MSPNYTQSYSTILFSVPHLILPLTVILPVTIAVDSVYGSVCGSAYLVIIPEPSVLEVGPT